MKLRIACVAVALVMAPTLSLAMVGCGSKHSKQAMSCAAGTSYDEATGTCVADPTT